MLFEKTNQQQKKAQTYSVQDIINTFTRLQQESGNCTQVFRKYGIPFQLSIQVKEFVAYVEKIAFHAIAVNPSVLQSDWEETVFSQYCQDAKNGDVGPLFADIQNPQFYMILDDIRSWQPTPQDKHRTFDEFVWSLVPNAKRPRPKSTEPNTEKAETKVKAPPKTRRYTPKTGKVSKPKKAQQV